MQIQVISEIGELAQYKDTWDGLLRENSNDNPYLTPDWITNWWNFFGSGRRLYTIVLTDGGEEVGFCPLMVCKQPPRNEFRFVGYPQAGRMGFVVRRGYESPFARLVMEHLLTMKGNVIINLHGMKREDPCLPHIRQALSGRICYTCTQQSRIIRLDAFESAQYFKSRQNHNTISRTYSRERSLGKLCSLTFEKAKPDDISIIFPLHQKRWLKKVDGNGFGKGVSKDFFKFIAGKAKPDSFHVMVYLLKAGTIPIGFVYGIECNGNLIFYRIAHDDDFAVFKPGMILIKKLIEECYTQGYSKFDFCVGDEPYKAYWTDETEIRESIRFGTDTIFVHALLFYSSLKQSLRARLKKIEFLSRFKRVTFGRIRYFLSGAFILTLFARMRNLLQQEGAASLLYNASAVLAQKITDDKYYIFKVKPAKPPDAGSGNVLSYTASLDDLPLLTVLLNCSPDRITRRYLKGEKCQIFQYGNKTIAYLWFANAQAAPSKQINWSPAKNGDRCCYEFHVFRMIERKQLVQDILACLSRKLSPAGRAGLYLGIPKANKELCGIAHHLFIQPNSSLSGGENKEKLL